ncbi:hypothetical protein BGZ91_009642, partial [Linnemannia elongata]
MPCPSKHFPCISRTLNLTRRTAVPQSTSKNIFSLQRIKKAVKPAAEVYLLPVVILLEREYVSIQTLKTTTLQLAGLVRGNSAFRVLMRYTDAGIEDFLEDIERDYSQSTATAATPTATSASIATSAPANPVTESPPVSQSRPESQSQRAVPERQSTLKPVTPTRKFTSDKTAGEGGNYLVAHEAYQGGGGSNPPIGLTPRAGDVEASNRENSVQIEGGSGDLNMQRQTPAQDMTSNMIEINQGIRRHQEQQTQAALTDRVKRLSKASDSSDRDRFVRSLPPGSPTPEAFTEEPEGFMD